MRVRFPSPARGFAGQEHEHQLASDLEDVRARCVPVRLPAARITCRQMSRTCHPTWALSQGAEGRSGYAKSSGYASACHRGVGRPGRRRSLASATSPPVAAGPLANLPARLQALDVPGKLGRSRRRDALRDRHMIERRCEVGQGRGDDPLCLAGAERMNHSHESRSKPTARGAVQHCRVWSRYPPGLPDTVEPRWPGWPCWCGESRSRAEVSDLGDGSGSTFGPTWLDQRLPERPVFSPRS